VIKDVQKLVEEAVANGRDPMPKKVVLQTRTLEYATMFWVTLTSQAKAWEDSRIEAEIGADGALTIKTSNVNGFDVCTSGKGKWAEC